MVGTLPTNLSSDVSYRGNAFVYEATSDQLGFTDLSGGWCTGNEVGKLLSAQPVFVSVSVSSTPVQKFCCSYHQVELFGACNSSADAYVLDCMYLIVGADKR